MKSLVLLFSMTAVLLMTHNSCASKKWSSGDFQRQWMMVSFKNYSREVLVKNRAQLDLAATKSPADQYRATMGCNEIFIKALFYKNGNVKFSQIGITEMFCGEIMPLETDFIKTLPEMTKYQITGHQLTLTNAEGTEMKFIAADWD